MKTTGKQSGNQTFNKDCVLYYRVSTDPQDTDSQQQECLRYCKTNGYTIVKDFEETKSGRKDDRVRMTECLNYIRDNQINTLILAEVSRLSRTLQGSEIIRHLTKDRVCVIGIRDDIKTLDDNFNEDREMTARASQAVTDAIKESNRISKRTTKGTRSKVIFQGIWTGGKYLPFGYQSLEGKLVIEPKEAEYVKLIFEKYLLGWGSIKISNWLNMEGIPTKLNKKWQRSTINQLLLHTIYKGNRLFEGKELDTPQLRIIDDKTFNAVQLRRKERKNSDRTFNNLRKYDYLFNAGLIKCGVCGKNFHGAMRKDSTDGVYKCISTKYHRGCGCESAKISQLELNIQQYIGINQFKLIYDNTKAVQINEKYEIDIELLKQEHIKYEDELKRINYKYQKARISEIEYDQEYEAVLKQLQKVSDSIKVIQDKQSQTKPITEQTIFKNHLVLNELTGQYELKKIEIDRDTIHSIIKQITIDKRTDDNKRINVELVNGNTFKI